MSVVVGVRKEGNIRKWCKRFWQPNSKFLPSPSWKHFIKTPSNENFHILWTLYSEKTPRVIKYIRYFQMLIHFCFLKMIKMLISPFYVYIDQKHYLLPLPWSSHPMDDLCIQLNKASALTEIAIIVGQTALDLIYLVCSAELVHFKWMYPKGDWRWTSHLISSSDQEQPVWLLVPNENFA